MSFEYDVLTVRDLDFMDERKQRVSGQQLWVCGQSGDAGWNGYIVEKLWIPDGHALESIVSGLTHGDRVQISYDRRGKPVSIEVIQ